MIQYRHRNCDKAFTPATFAYELPPASLFMHMVNYGEPVINFPFGMTVLHEKDYYCRATGREYALRSLQSKVTHSFYCEKIELRNNRTYFHLLSGYINKKALSLCVSVNFDTAKVRLEYIDLETDA